MTTSYNRGPPTNGISANGGSSIFWDNRGVVAEGGSLRGECINLAELVVYFCVLQYLLT